MMLANYMMDDWGYGGGMMGGSILGYLIMLAVLINLILLGAWLYKQINKK